MREGKRSQGLMPLASLPTKQTARKDAPLRVYTKNAHLLCCAPRHRSLGYDLRRAPRIYAFFVSNAISRRVLQQPAGATHRNASTVCNRVFCVSINPKSRAPPSAKDREIGGKMKKGRGNPYDTASRTSVPVCGTGGPEGMPTQTVYSISL